MESPLLHQQKLIFRETRSFLCLTTDLKKLKEATQVMFGDALALTAGMEKLCFQGTDPDCLSVKLVFFGSMKVNVDRAAH